MSATGRRRTERRADCHPDFVCDWHGVCSGCGDTIHLATVETDFDFDVDSMAEFICGTPPRCAECRSRAT